MLKFKRPQAGTYRAQDGEHVYTVVKGTGRTWTVTVAFVRGDVPASVITLDVVSCEQGKTACRLVARRIGEFPGPIDTDTYGLIRTDVYWTVTPPADTTKTALADTAARRAIVFARKNDQPLTRLRLAEAMQAVFHSPRYENVPHPAWATVVKSVKRQARWDRDIVVRLSVNDAENRI